MSDYPKQGRGIVLEKNPDATTDSLTKYNIRVTKSLQSLLQRPDVVDSVGWVQDPDRPDWWVIGYTVAEDGEFNGAASDTDCKGG